MRRVLWVTPSTFRREGPRRPELAENQTDRIRRGFGQTARHVDAANLDGVFRDFNWTEGNLAA